MFRKDIPTRDRFTFSLGGMTAIASFVAPTVIASDRINKVRDQRLRQVRDDRDRKTRSWLASQGQAAQADCV